MQDGGGRGGVAEMCPWKAVQVSFAPRNVPSIGNLFQLLESSLYCFGTTRIFFLDFQTSTFFFGSIITKQVQSVGFCTPGLHILFHKTKIHQLKILFGVHQHYAACLKNQYMFNS
jgi:hypothetical protein